MAALQIPNQPNSKSFKGKKREISSGIIVFRKFPEGPSYLLLYRGHNQWTFPRGKIEGEERSFAAALRETREETGLNRNDLHFVDYFKAYENWSFIKNNEKIYKTVILYLAETRKKQVKLEEDFEGFCWFPYEHAMRIFTGSKNDENRKILNLVHDFLMKSVFKKPVKRNPDAQRERPGSRPPRPAPESHSEGI